MGIWKRLHGLCSILQSWQIMNIYHLRMSKLCTLLLVRVNHQGPINEHFMRNMLILEEITFDEDPCIFVKHHKMEALLIYDAI